MPNNAARLLILFALVYQLLLSGCSISPSQPTTKDAGQSVEQRLEQLYQLAKQSDSQKSAIYRVEAADLLNQQQRFDEAAAILKDISPSSLPVDARATYVLVQADISLSQLDGKTALDNLNKYSDLILQQGEKAELRAAVLRARSFALLDRHLDSARERIHLAPMLDSEQRHDNEMALWNELIKIPSQQLQQAATRSSPNSDEQGWLTLALLKQANKANLDNQYSALQRWLQRWASHPAALNLPQELTLLDRIINERPNNVTLMLPLQGRNALAGKAIRDGFMAAYYNAKAAGDYTPDIRIVDTTPSADFKRLYDETSLQGTDFIIGPLEKQDVQILLDSGSLSIPTLALNYGTQGNSTEQLYQFGLAAEDEARQIAEKAWAKGYKTSLVLAPSTSWGQRIAGAFSKRWEELNGFVLESAYFDADKGFSSAIAELLDFDISKQRANNLRNIIGEEIKFNASGRNDADFIFVVATPEQARQIKPTLAFHFAGKLPVYATSHIYSGTPEPLLNRDLNGIIFVETPWILDYKNDLVKQAVITTWPSKAERLGRLYALGVDAYQLYPRIQLLSTNHSNTLAGATGLLTLDDSGRVTRTLNWAHFRNGLIEPLP